MWMNEYDDNKLIKIYKFNNNNKRNKEEWWVFALSSGVLLLTERKLSKNGKIDVGDPYICPKWQFPDEIFMNFLNKLFWQTKEIKKELFISG